MVTDETIPVINVEAAKHGVGEAVGTQAAVIARFQNGGRCLSLRLQYRVGLWAIMDLLSAQ